MGSELLYQIALTQVPHIGDVHARLLVEHCGGAEAVFREKASSLSRIEGIGVVRARAVKQYDGFAALESELRFIERYGIRTHFITDERYPQRLLQCPDPPVLLFAKGDIDLNPPRAVAIVGTRNASEWARRWTEGLVTALQPLGATIISGLAYGIDAAAHQAALRQDLPTLGVVGHGLARLYPPEHSGMAREMVRNGGGLLSEFLSDTKPDKHNFPLRNRIVAGLSDAVVVVETAAAGGSMITAKLADGYHRDVFAVPGRPGDRYSSGCHELVRTQKAHLLTEARQLIEMMGWTEGPRPAVTQPALFVELNPQEKLLTEQLQQGPVHIDELQFRSGLRGSEVAVLLLGLELRGVVRAMAGKRYVLA